jgi:hypothetical protein
MSDKPIKIPPPVADEVAGPSPNPATNLLLADVVVRMGSYVMRYGIERAFLAGRYGKGTAKEIVKGRTIPQSLVAVAIAKLGTRSLPGAALVGAGLVAKTLLDRSRSRRGAQIEGDVKLIKQAKK